MLGNGCEESKWPKGGRTRPTCTCLCALQNRKVWRPVAFLRRTDVSRGETFLTVLPATSFPYHVFWLLSVLSERVTVSFFGSLFLYSQFKHFSRGAPWQVVHWGCTPSPETSLPLPDDWLREGHWLSWGQQQSSWGFWFSHFILEVGRPAASREHQDTPKKVRFCGRQRREKKNRPRDII